MSTTTTPAPAETANPAPAVPPAAPAAPSAPAVAPAAALPAPAAAPVAPQEIDPAWLNPRLDRAQETARNKVLAELGVTSVEEAKAVIAAKRAKDEAEKTELQRAQEAARAAEELKAKNQELTSIVSDHAQRELALLKPEQADAVRAIAGTNPAAVLQTIAKLKPTWAASSPAPAAPAPAAPAAPSAPAAPQAAALPAAPAPAAPAAPARPLPPATTAPPAGGPAPAAPAVTDHAAIYDQLKQVHPIRAAAYYQQHGAAIKAAKSRG